MAITPAEKGLERSRLIPAEGTPGKETLAFFGMLQGGAKDHPYNACVIKKKL